MNGGKFFFDDRKTWGFEILILVLLFFTPRLIFLNWFTHYSTAYQDQSISAREPSSVSDGNWALLAKGILEGRSRFVTSDDIGIPLLMSVLARGGVSFRRAFYLSCLFLMIISFIFLTYLYLFLKKKNEMRIVMALMCYCALYPPGIYFGFSSVARIFPVYAFLVSVVILIYSKELFAEHSLSRLLLFLGISFFANFLILARNTNKPIFFALLVALGLKILFDKLSFKPYLAFVFLFLSGTFLAHNFVPPAEHSVWHPIYLGLGDFDNKYKIEIRDHFANEKAREFNPKLSSGSDIDLDPEYERTLKKMVVGMISKDPFWYLRFVTMRFLKITLVPFQGSWMMPVSEAKQNEMVRLGQLLNGFQLAVYRIYVGLDTATAIVDLLLTIIGGVTLFFVVSKNSWRQSIPYVILLGGTLQIYTFVMVSNRTIFLAGTYFYQFFAVWFLSRVIFLLMDELSPIWIRLKSKRESFFHF